MTEKKDHAFFAEKHRHEVLWQIWLPVGFGALAMFSLGFLAAFSLQTGSDASVRWGHVAAIWLILPLFVAGLIALIFLISLCVAFFKLTDLLPGYAIMVQNFINRLALRIQSLADRSIQPVIGLHAQKASIKRLSVAIRYLLLGGFRD